MSGRSRRATGLLGDGHPFGAYAEYICLRENPKAGRSQQCVEPELQEAAAIPTGKRGLAVPAQGERAERTEGPGQWSGRELRHVRGPTRQGPRAHVTAVDAAPKLEMLRTSAQIASSTTPRRTSPAALNLRRHLRRSPQHTVWSHGEVADENGYLLMPIRGSCSSFAPGGRRGEQEAGRVRGSGPRSEDLAYLRGLAEAGRLRPSSTGASRSSRWSKLTGTPKPVRSWAHRGHGRVGESAASQRSSRRGSGRGRIRTLRLIVGLVGVLHRNRGEDGACLRDRARTSRATSSVSASSVCEKLDR